ncbi:uncharacterized protein LOC119333072 [Triticum dicoccoides]|uniref:uncharacterized protein LOC119333072 n=1 Tax=Triticum dicoccoides TaxID=85692 RepID=UPI0018915954|nr:uncharacterized protein LOC119333072 [Triticum dicoccoides]
MAFSSFPWLFCRRAGGSGSDGTGPSKPSVAEGKEEDAEELGVTPQLLDFLRTLSPDAFKSAVLCFVTGRSAESAAELSDWQRRHAVLVLARAKELAKVRYDLCPCHVKDKQFWTYILS